MRIALVAVVVFFVGCGGDEGSFTCSKESRTGTYLVTYETLGGTCGDLPPMVVVGGTPVSSDCTVNFDRWSTDECTLERTLTCTDASGVIVETQAVTTQAAADGSRITGTATYTLRNTSSVTLCVGTYDMTYARQ
jgi:hypothetical protein